MMASHYLAQVSHSNKIFKIIFVLTNISIHYFPHNASQQFFPSLLSVPESSLKAVCHSMKQTIFSVCKDQRRHTDDNVVHNNLTFVTK